MRIRALIIGLMGVVILGMVIPRCDFFGIGTHIAATFMPIGPVFLLFFFVLVLNPLLKILRIGLTPVELLLVYAMMTIGCGFASCSVQYLIPAIAGPFYFATPENRYAEVLHKFIPDWFVPKNPDTIKYLYEGLPKGMSIPWNQWIVPIFWWTLLLLAVALAGFCIAIIVRKQWFENERLVFPLVYVPVEMVKEDEGSNSLVPHLFKNKLMWIAFLIPFIIYTLRGLHFYFPVVPDTNNILMMKWFTFTEKPWNSLNFFFMQILFTTIGLTYFVPTTISFSIWFFYLFFQLQIIIGAVLGFPMPFFPGEAFTRAFQAYQVAGGIIALAVLLLWSMRHSLKDIGSHKLALTGFVLSFVFICFWGVIAGAKFWSVILYFLIFFAIVMVVSRLMAEAGLFYVGYKIFPFEVMLPFTGTNSVGGAGLMTFVIWNQGIQREFRVDTMPFFLNNLKMGETAKINKKWLVISMWIAMLVGLPVIFFTVISLMYNYGGVNVGQWWTTSVSRDIVCRNAMRYITTPISPSVKDILTMITGAGVTLFLFWMTRVFLWWPFHPIGYVMAGSYSICHLWWPVFLGWLIKSLVLKFGGIKIYQKLAPAFIGLVLGECATIGGWVVLDLILRTRGNFLIWL